MELKLVNPYFIKQLPGRKSDVKDAQWIAECLLKNLIKGRLCARANRSGHAQGSIVRIFDLQEDVTYYSNKLDAALHRCGFRLSNYVAKITGKSLQEGGGVNRLRCHGSQ